MMDRRIRVALVDDEYLVLELLNKKIDWIQLGCEVVFKGNSALQALDYMDENPVDVLLTDINMPVVDGLALSKRVRHLYPKSHILLLTGYDAFEYAREGIRIGIDEYLLKPIDEEAIETAISRVVLKIKEETQREIQYEILENHLIEQKPYLMEKFMNDLLQGRLDSSVIEQKGVFFQLPIEGSRHQIGIVEVKGNATYDYVEFIRLKLLIQEHLKTYPSIYVFVDYKERIVLYGDAWTSDFIEELRYLIRIILSSTPWEVAIGISRPKSAMEDLNRAYQEAIMALNYKMIAGLNSVIFYNDIRLAMDPVTPIQDLEDAYDALEFAIKAGLKEEALLNVGKIYSILESRLRSDTQLDETFIKVQTTRLASFIQYIALSMRHHEQLDNSETTPDFNRLGEVITLPESRRIIEPWLTSLMDVVNTVQHDKENDFFTDIESYIDAHICDSDLSLKNTAEAFYLNASYLSRLYKQRTGQSFKQYVIEKRMLIAIEQLKHTEKKVYEISEEVGISDPNYFGVCFKKYVGKSVSEYRKGFR